MITTQSQLKAFDVPEIVWADEPSDDESELSGLDEPILKDNRAVERGRQDPYRHSDAPVTVHSREFKRQFNPAISNDAGHPLAHHAWRAFERAGFPRVKKNVAHPKPKDNPEPRTVRDLPHFELLLQSFHTVNPLSSRGFRCYQHSIANGTDPRSAYASIIQNPKNVAYKVNVQEHRVLSQFDCALEWHNTQAYDERFDYESLPITRGRGPLSGIEKMILNNFISFLRTRPTYVRKPAVAAAPSPLQRLGLRLSPEATAPLYGGQHSTTGCGVHLQMTLTEAEFIITSKFGEDPIGELLAVQLQLASQCHHIHHCVVDCCVYHSLEAVIQMMRQIDDNHDEILGTIPHNMRYITAHHGFGVEMTSPVYGGQHGDRSSNRRDHTHANQRHLLDHLKSMQSKLRAHNQRLRRAGQAPVTVFATAIKNKADPILLHAVARFKRTGELPDPSVLSRNQHAIDKKAFKQMRLAMLLEQGIEPNPGPLAEMRDRVHAKIREVVSATMALQSRIVFPIQPCVNFATRLALVIFLCIVVPQLIMRRTLDGPVCPPLPGFSYVWKYYVPFNPGVSYSGSNYSVYVVGQAFSLGFIDESCLKEPIFNELDHIGFGGVWLPLSGWTRNIEGDINSAIRACDNLNHPFAHTTKNYIDWFRSIMVQAPRRIHYAEVPGNLSLPMLLALILLFALSYQCGLVTLIWHNRQRIVDFSITMFHWTLRLVGIEPNPGPYCPLNGWKITIRCTPTAPALELFKCDDCHEIEHTKNFFTINHPNPKAAYTQGIHQLICTMMSSPRFMSGFNHAKFIAICGCGFMIEKNLAIIITYKTCGSRVCACGLKDGAEHPLHQYTVDSVLANLPDRSERPKDVPEHCASRSMLDNAEQQIAQSTVVEHARSNLVEILKTQEKPKPPKKESEPKVCRGYELSLTETQSYVDHAHYFLRLFGTFVEAVLVPGVSVDPKKNAEMDTRPPQFHGSERGDPVDIMIYSARWVCSVPGAVNLFHALPNIAFTILAAFDAFLWQLHCPTILLIAIVCCSLFVHRAVSQSVSDSSEVMKSGSLSFAYSPYLVSSLQHTIERAAIMSDPKSNLQTTLNSLPRINIDALWYHEITSNSVNVALWEHYTNFRMPVHVLRACAQQNGGSGCLPSVTDQMKSIFQSPSQPSCNTVSSPSSSPQLFDLAARTSPNCPSAVSAASAQSHSIVMTPEPSSTASSNVSPATSPGPIAASSSGGARSAAAALPSGQE